MTLFFSKRSFCFSYRVAFSVLNDARSKQITSAENISIVWVSDQLFNKLCSLSGGWNLKRKSISCTGAMLKVLFVQSSFHSSENLLRINDSLNKVDKQTVFVFNNWRAFGNNFLLTASFWCAIRSVKICRCIMDCKHKKPRWSRLEAAVD